MNLKQVVILLVLVAVLGAAGFIVLKQQKDSWNSSEPAVGRKLFGDFASNEVAQIVIRQGSNEVNLVQKSDGWHVAERHDYPASPAQIWDLLFKVGSVKAVQIDKVGPSQLYRFQLGAGQGTNDATTVEFKGPGGKIFHSLFAGKKHFPKSRQPSPFGDAGDEGLADGRYVRVDGDKESVVLVAEAFDGVAAAPERWLSKDFIHVEKPRSIEAIFPVATNSWKLARETETGDWTLADARPGEQLDATKASGVAYPLGSVTFADVAPGGKLEGSGTNRPAAVKIETFEDFAYTINVGSRTDDEYPMTVNVTARIQAERAPGKDETPEDKARLDKEFKEAAQQRQEKLKREQRLEPWTFRVSNYSVEPLLKERSQLLVDKKEPLPGGSSTKAIGGSGEPMIEFPPLPAIHTNDHAP